MHKRLKINEYFMKIAQTVAQRGTCPRKQVGAVIVKNKEIISTGYNGAPKGFKHCLEIGCLIKNSHCVRAVHAEQNALIQAGKKANGATIYCTAIPCEICFKLCINAGIKEIYYLEDYNNKDLKWILKESKIKLIKMEEIKNE